MKYKAYLDSGAVIDFEIDSERLQSFLADHIVWMSGENGVVVDCRHVVAFVPATNSTAVDTENEVIPIDHIIVDGDGDKWYPQDGGGWACATAGVGNLMRRDVERGCYEGMTYGEDSIRNAWGITTHYPRG